MPAVPVVVIGSGPCGAIAAKVLSDRGLPVTVLESGRNRVRGLVVRAKGNTIVRWMPPNGIQSGPRHRAVGDPATAWYSNLSPGGLSNNWTAAVPRFDPDDFTDGARLDERYRWPIGYADLEPYYAFAERILTVTGSDRDVSCLPHNRVAYPCELPPDWQALAPVAARLGHGLAPMPMAKGSKWMVARRGTEFNSYTNVVHHLVGRPGFRYAPGRHVTQLVFDASRGRVGAVECAATSTGATETVPAAAVVVAAGALDSTRLLLASRSPEHPDGLGNAHGLLGRYLHDHPKQWWPFALTSPLTLPAHPVYVTRRAHAASEPLVGASWTIGLERGAHRPRTWIGAKGTTFGVQVFGTMRPVESNEVRLSTSAHDAHGRALLEIDMRYDDEALATMHDAQHTAARLFDEAGLGYRMLADPSRPVPGDSVHYAGSARMHADPRHGVVDGDNLVHGVANVAVVDASCFTTCSEKNPTLTAMAIASRAADRMADRLLGAVSVRPVIDGRR